jgi:Kef-type K+ transport system membrane component KefB
VLSGLVRLTHSIRLSLPLTFLAPLEAFILGTALCSTSLGTTFVLLSSASKANSNSSDPDSDATTSNDVDTDCADYSQTRVGTVLVSAALLDDVCGLVLVSVIHNLRDIAGPEVSVSPFESHSSQSLGWIIGRPVLASVLMALLTPAVGFFVALPVYRRFVEPCVRRLAQWAHVINIVLMAFALGGFLAIAAYAGASVLFGSFLAGAFLSSLSTEDTESSALDDGTIPGFAATFSHYLGSAQRFIFQPLFFASVGFAIPFTELWTGEVIWKGVVYTFLMAFGKLVVGLVIPACDLLAHRRKDIDTPTRASWGPAALLGSAMVARGEIGLLIIQVGLNETPFLTHKAFAIGVWAIVLNTILGPVMVGMLLKRAGKLISTDPRWGFQAKQDVATPAQ